MIRSDRDKLTDRESCRTRPGMYIGHPDDGSGLQNLVWEVLGNAVDVFLRGEATKITLDLCGITITVADDGPGIDITPKDGVPRLVKWLTSFHDSGTADDHYPHVHLRPAFWGMGLATAFFLSEHFECETIRAGRRYRVVGHQGLLQGGLEDLGPSDGRGTRIRMVPDATVLGQVLLDLNHFRPRLDHLVAFNPRLDLWVQGQRIVFDNGVRDLLLRGIDGATPLGPLFYHKGGSDGIAVEIALQWFPGVGAKGIRSFMNHAVTTDGGTHVTGMLEALRQVLPSYAAGDGYGWDETRMRDNLAMVIHAEMRDPRFGGPTRDHLISAEVEQVVFDTISPALSVWLADQADFRLALWRHLGLRSRP